GELVFLKIADPGQGRVRTGAEEEPSDVGMEKSLGNIIGVVVMIDKLMMAPMVSRPRQGRAFEGRCTKEQGEHLHRPSGLKTEMRKEPMIAQRDAHSGGEGE